MVIKGVLIIVTNLVYICDTTLHMSELKRDTVVVDIRVTLNIVDIMVIKGVGIIVANHVDLGVTIHMSVLSCRFMDILV